MYHSCEEICNSKLGCGLLKTRELLYFQNLVPDILSVGDKMMLIVDIVVDDDEGLFGVLEVVLLCSLSNQGNAVLLDEGDDLFVGGGLLAQRVCLVLVGRPEDLGHEDGDGLQWDLLR